MYQCDSCLIKGFQHLVVYDRPGVLEVIEDAIHAADPAGTVHVAETAAGMLMKLGSRLDLLSYDVPLFIFIHGANEPHSYPPSLYCQTFLAGAYTPDVPCESEVKEARSFGLAAGHWRQEAGGPGLAVVVLTGGNDKEAAEIAQTVTTPIGYGCFRKLPDRLPAFFENFVKEGTPNFILLSDYLPPVAALIRLIDVWVVSAPSDRQALSPNSFAELLNAALRWIEATPLIARSMTIRFGSVNRRQVYQTPIWMASLQSWLADVQRQLDSGVWPPSVWPPPCPPDRCGTLRILGPFLPGDDFMAILYTIGYSLDVITMTTVDFDDAEFHLTISADPPAVLVVCTEDGQGKSDEEYLHSIRVEHPNIIGIVIAAEQLLCAAGALQVHSTLWQQLECEEST